MMRPQIVALWGTADHFDVVFNKVKGIEWQCSVPPDLSDGSYVCEFTALNEYGEQAVWIGELFMSNGVCHINFQMPKYLFWFQPNDVTYSVCETERIEYEIEPLMLFNEHKHINFNIVECENGY